MTSHCITWHDTTQAITSHQMTWPSHDLTPEQTSRHQNTSLQSTKHHHHGRAEGSFTAKKWFGHRAGRSPCTFYRQILSVLYSSFPFGNFRPRLVRALLVYKKSDLPKHCKSGFLEVDTGPLSKFMFYSFGAAPQTTTNQVLANSNHLVRFHWSRHESVGKTFKAFTRILWKSPKNPNPFLE